MDNRSPYLSAEQLGIEPWERDGLIELVGLFEANKLPLDMGITRNECGTVACIGGWLAIRHGLSRIKVSSYVNCQDSLRELFFPIKEETAGTFLSVYRATPNQAARAIINFLMTKDPQWSTIYDT